MLPRKLPTVNSLSSFSSVSSGCFVQKSMSFHKIIVPCILLGQNGFFSARFDGSLRKT